MVVEQDRWPVYRLILAALAIGLIYLYSRQPSERREQIKTAAGKIGTAMMDDFTTTMARVEVARGQLQASVVPGPGDRIRESAVIRELAMAEESLSAQQLAELLDESVRPSVNSLRAFLRANDKTIFAEVRRGGFVVGRHYRLPQPSAPPDVGDRRGESPAPCRDPAQPLPLVARLVPHRAATRRCTTIRSASSPLGCGQDP